MDDLIAELEDQERRLVLPRLDPDDAWRLGTSLVAMARERGLSVTVDVRHHGHRLFHVAMAGTTPENDSWVERKAAVVQRFAASSYLVGRRLAAKGQQLDEALGVDPLEHAAHGGSFPLRVAGVGVIGSVTVSGLAQDQDHALVVEALQAHLDADGASAPPA